MGAIYSITFVGSSRIYVGSAVNPRTRWQQHSHLLRKGRHHSVLLQRAWAKYGSESARFKIIEEVDDDNLLLVREQHWMNANADRLYNRSPTAESRLGAKMSIEARRKISASLIGNKRRLGKPFPPEDRAKISAAVRTAIKDGRKIVAIRPENLAAFNAAVKAGIVPHPSRNPERDAAIVASHARTKSPKATGAEFGITPEAVWHVVRRVNPSQLRRWRRKCTQ